MFDFFLVGIRGVMQALIRSTTYFIIFSPHLLNSSLIIPCISCKSSDVLTLSFCSPRSFVLSHVFAEFLKHMHFWKTNPCFFASFYQFNITNYSHQCFLFTSVFEWGFTWVM
ncbi:hypothetical protein EUGRSUZ_K01373 [Eucalyptus grandis]|uniref:Uncharacterized protein n=2 Tax=Eucalyptus grandis TaxID=71139 RepID=A0ACC3IUW6_EUCGR|nr:hypothetical protein EUGRSUZ_K01373 [Eucalyptus grandis]